MIDRLWFLSAPYAASRGAYLSSLAVGCGLNEIAPSANSSRTSHLSPDGGSVTHAAVHRLAEDGYGKSKLFLDLGALEGFRSVSEKPSLINSLGGSNGCDPPNLRITQGRFAKALRRRPVAPIPGNRRVPYCLEQDTWESLSIGTPYVAGRKLRPRRIVNLFEVFLPADRFRNREDPNRFFSTSRLAFGTHRSYSVIPW